MIEKLVQVDIHHTREVPIERVVEKILQVDVEHIREVPVERIVEKVPPPSPSHEEVTSGLGVGKHGCDRGLCIRFGRFCSAIFGFLKSSGFLKC